MGQLQRKHGFNNVFRLNNETILGLEYYDITKNEEEYEYYIDDAIKGYFLVTLVISSDKKIQKRFHKGTMRKEDWNNGGNYSVKNLLLVKDKLCNLKSELNVDEVFIVSGHDERRFKVYNRFLSKDKRFTFCITGGDSFLYIHRDWLFKNTWERSVFDNTVSYFSKLEEHKSYITDNCKPEEFTNGVYGEYSYKRKKQREKEVEQW